MLNVVYLRNQFPSGLTAPLAQGATGLQVTAVQLALGELGHLDVPVDGSFGPGTERAVRALQRASGLPETGRVDAATLAALDRGRAATDPTVAAAKAPDPLAYLSDFPARGLAPIARPAAAEARWSDPATRDAFGAFVGAYWEVMKSNRVEADCKTLALFFMDQFRAKYGRDTGLSLPMPGVGGASLPPISWSSITARNTRGYFSKVGDRALRPEYAAAKHIEKVDPTHSMIFGVNVAVAGGITCATVGQRATVEAWSTDNQGDRTKAEVPLEHLRAGSLIFMNHDGDNDWDHAITVVRVERQGDKAKVVLAVGSFDDVKDADTTTLARGAHDVNHYAEEVTVVLERGRVPADGGQTTWASEPGYLRKREYSAFNTLMDAHPRSRLAVARWGDARDARRTSA